MGLSKKQIPLRYDINLILKGFVYGSLSIVAAKIINYFWRIYVARLGTDVYGAVSIGIAFFSFMIIFSSFGMLKASGRFISESYAKRNFKKIMDHYVSLSFFSFILSSTISFIIFYFRDFIALTFFKNPIFGDYVGVVALATPVVLIGRILGSFAIRVNKAVGFYNFAVYIWTSTLRIILLFWFLSSFCSNGFYAFLSYVLAEVGYFFIVWIYFVKNGVRYLKRASISWKLFKKVFLFSLPLTFSFMIGKIFPYVDTFFINYYKGLDFTGIYNAAIPLAQLILLSFTTVSPFFVTIISERYYKKDTISVFKLTDAINRYIFAFNSFIVGVFVLYGKEIITILFGKDYIDAYLPLIILSLNYLFLTKGYLFSRIVLNIGKSIKYIPYVTLTSLILNVFLNIVLIPIYGMVGGALATFISTFYATIIHYIKAKQVIPELNYLTLKHLFAVIFSFLVLYGINKFIHFFVPYFNITLALIFLIVSFVFYALVIVKARVVKKEELYYIFSLFKKKISL